MSGCICKGNWRAIIGECGPLIGKKFKDSHGEYWTFFGVVYGDDDYYYGMCNKDRLRLLSCVGSFECHGFEISDQ